MTAEELKEALVSGNILYISDPQIANGIPLTTFSLRKLMVISHNGLLHFAVREKLKTHYTQSRKSRHARLY